MAEAIGTLSGLAYGTANPTTIGMEFLSESIAKENTIARRTGIRGTVDDIVDGSRIIQKLVSGAITSNPGVTDLNSILPHIMGAAGTVGTPTGKTTFALGTTYSSLYFCIDRRTGVQQYSGCKIAQATFRATQGSPLEMELQIEGTDESSVSFPSVTYPATDLFILPDAAFTLASTAYEIAGFEVVIQLMLATDRWNNSLTRTSLPLLQRIISMNIDAPYTSANSALYDQAVAGAAANILLTDGNYSLKFNTDIWQVPARTPVVSGKKEIMLPTLNGRCLKSVGGSTEAMSIVLDLTG